MLQLFPLRPEKVVLDEVFLVELNVEASAAASIVLLL